MFLKNRHRFIDWRFFIDGPDNIEIVIPEHGRCNSIFHLSENVLKQLGEFDKYTKGEFTKKPREEAKSLKMDFYDYMKTVIEHQICIRQDKPEEICSNGGLGDKIHAQSHKIDKAVAKLPKPLKKAAENAIRGVTRIVNARGSTKLGGCASCGGRRSFSSQGQNLGRAAKVNKFFKK